MTPRRIERLWVGQCSVLGFVEAGNVVQFGEGVEEGCGQLEEVALHRPRRPSAELEGEVLPIGAGCDHVHLPFSEASERHWCREHKRPTQSVASSRPFVRLNVLLARRGTTSAPHHRVTPRPADPEGPAHDCLCAPVVVEHDVALAHIVNEVVTPEGLLVLAKQGRVEIDPEVFPTITHLIQYFSNGSPTHHRSSFGAPRRLRFAAIVFEPRTLERPLQEQHPEACRLARQARPEQSTRHRSGKQGARCGEPRKQPARTHGRAHLPSLLVLQAEHAHRQRLAARPGAGMNKRHAATSLIAPGRSITAEPDRGKLTILTGPQPAVNA